MDDGRLQLWMLTPCSMGASPSVSMSDLDLVEMQFVLQLQPEQHPWPDWSLLL